MACPMTAIRTTSSCRSTRSGLGLPDRDYYFKTEARFQEARAKYLAHVQKMFELAGYPASDAKAAAQTVMRMETSLAQHSLDNVALRDPKSTDHKMTFAQLQQLTPNFGWQQYYSASKLPAGELNVAEPEFMKEVDRQLAATSLADWKTYLSWHLLHSAAPSLSKAFVQEDFAFNSAYLEGAKEMKPRWKQCAESADAQLGEAVGKIYVEKYFPPQAKARVQDMVKNLRLAMGETIEGLQWMSAATKKRALEKLSTFNPKIGYPDKWLDYSAVPISRESYWNNVVAGRQFNVRDNWSTDRQAAGSRSLGHHHADFRRVLQSAAERDRLPRRHSAAARLRPGRERCGQLWRHRRRDRSRDQPRLRRSRRTVRRARAAEELVERRRPQSVSNTHGLRREAVRRLLHRARHSSQRQAGARRKHRRPGRRADRLSRVGNFPPRQGAAANDRRLHSGTTVLHRLGPVPRR